MPARAAWWRKATPLKYSVPLHPALLPVRTGLCLRPCLGVLCRNGSGNGSSVCSPRFGQDLTTKLILSTEACVTSFAWRDPHEKSMKFAHEENESSRDRVWPLAAQLEVARSWMGSGHKAHDVHAIALPWGLPGGTCVPVTWSPQSGACLPISMSLEGYCGAQRRKLALCL